VPDPTPTIAAIPNVLRACSTLDQSVEALTAELQPYFPIDRTSVRILDREGMHLVLVSVWSPSGTNLQVGTRVRAAATSFATMLSERRPVLSIESLGEDPPSLLEQILMHEGLRSWVSCPLEEKHRPVGILSFSSRTEGAFRPRDGHFFRDLARSCQGELVRHARAALVGLSDDTDSGAERADAQSLGPRPGH
jgi:transcriptional regulator with GAF, ATPase, and Fis domain